MTGGIGTWHGRPARGAAPDSIPASSLLPQPHRQDADATWHGRPARGAARDSIPAS
jgi:hypothetical protein